MAEKQEKQQEETSVLQKRIRIFCAAVIVLAIVVSLLVAAISRFSRIADTKEDKNKKALARSITEEFVLKVGEPIPTAQAGPGTRHIIWSNKPYVAISVRPDNGQWIKYNMPGGQSSWNGAEPSGRLLLEGVIEETTVKIQKVR